MGEDEIKKELLKRSLDNKITCAEARKLAEDLGIAYAEVGAAADALGIRIRSCELGCFR